jgi:hypothetical protein
MFNYVCTHLFFAGSALWDAALSTCPLMFHLWNYWTNFYEIWYWNLHRNSLGLNAKRFVVRTPGKWNEIQIHLKNVRLHCSVSVVEITSTMFRRLALYQSSGKKAKRERERGSNESLSIARRISTADNGQYPENSLTLQTWHHSELLQSQKAAAVQNPMASRTKLETSQCSIYFRCFFLKELAETDIKI